MDSDTYQRIETARVLALYDIHTTLAALHNLRGQLEELAVPSVTLGNLDGVQEFLRMVSRDIAAYKVTI